MSESISSESTLRRLGPDPTEGFAIKIDDDSYNMSNPNVAVIGAGKFGRALANRI